MDLLGILRFGIYLEFGIWNLFGFIFKIRIAESLLQKMKKVIKEDNGTKSNYRCASDRFQTVTCLRLYGGIGKGFTK